MSLYYFQPGKGVKQLLLRVKHCRRSEHAFDKTHILYISSVFSRLILKAEVGSNYDKYSLKKIVTLTSVGYSGLHQWQSDTAYPYKYKWYL